MKMSWQEKEKTINVKAPNTLVISAFASTENVKNAVKPMFISSRYPISISILSQGT